MGVIKPPTVQKKKGWKKKAREEGAVSSGGVVLSGVRRKNREDEDDVVDLQEGETCGIKKKIVLDVCVLNNNTDDVAGPTNRALGGQ